MKTAIITVIIIISFVLLIASTGFYPVASVDGSFIFHRAWKKAENASKQYAEQELKRRGEKPLDFSLSENQKLLDEGRRKTLESLIEDRIVFNQGSNLVVRLDEISRDRIGQVVRNRANLSQAAKILYGFSLEEFEDFVLLPQARRDAVGEALSRSHRNFEEWFGEAKQASQVRLYFVPYQWDGMSLR